MKFVFKTAFRLLLYPMILLLCLILGTLVLFQIAPLRTKFLDFAAKEMGVELQVKSIHGWLPFQIQVEEAKLSKEGVPLFAIKDLQISLSPLDLFRGKITIADLTLIDPIFLPMQGKDPLTLPTLSLQHFHLEKEGWILEGSLESEKRAIVGDLIIEKQGFSIPFHLSLILEGTTPTFALTAKRRAHRHERKWQIYLQ